MHTHDAVMQRSCGISVREESVENRGGLDLHQQQRGNRHKAVLQCSSPEVENNREKPLY